MTSRPKKLIQSAKRQHCKFVTPYFTRCEASLYSTNYPVTKSSHDVVLDSWPSSRHADMVVVGLLSDIASATTSVRSYLQHTTHRRILGLLNYR